jgi:6-phosphogluconolactonase/glucosamine-6-phosphate isomerase/deaminase
MEMIFRTLDGKNLDLYDFGTIFYNEQRKLEVEMIVEFKNHKILTFTTKQIKSISHVFSDVDENEKENIIKDYYEQLINERLTLSPMSVEPSVGILRQTTSSSSTTVSLHFSFLPPPLIMTKGFNLYFCCEYFC